MSRLQRAVGLGLGILRVPLARVFGHLQSPLEHLGALTIFFCWIVLVSGIWLLIFFRTSVSGAFESVEYLTHQQWYLGGIMRSLHRYASDAAILTILLHVLREFSGDRYRGRRWFSWVSGVPLVWVVFVLGITGYWLVWDELAQFVAITSAELLDSLPIFTGSMAANFMSESALSDRFFTLMAFLHLIGLPIFLVFGIWLHVFRLSAARVNPPRRLMAGTLLALLVLAALAPAESHGPAQLDQVPQSVGLDWFYLHAFALVNAWNPGAVWWLLVATSMLLVIAPWLPPRPAYKPATVSLDNCNGCRRCADDCPFGAIQMVPRTDGLKFDTEAAVDPDLCVACGICVGSCPTATPFRTRRPLVPGIDLPVQPAAAIRDQLQFAAGAADARSPVLAFACRGSAAARELAAAGRPCVEVECMGQLPPSFIDYTLSRGLADGVYLAGCGDSLCRYRFGAAWTSERIDRVRDPRLRKRVDDARIGVDWADEAPGQATLAARIDAFADTLPKVDPASRDAAA